MSQESPICWSGVQDKFGLQTPQPPVRIPLFIFYFIFLESMIGAQAILGQLALHAAATDKALAKLFLCFFFFFFFPPKLIRL
jgi:hypothetical protein